MLAIIAWKGVGIHAATCLKQPAASGRRCCGPSLMSNHNGLQTDWPWPLIGYVSRLRSSCASLVTLVSDGDLMAWNLLTGRVE